MNREEFCQKIADCHSEEFPEGRTATFVCKDDQGVAWMIPDVPYLEEDVCYYAIDDIKSSKRTPVRAKPVFGIIGYQEDKDEADQEAPAAD